MQIARQVRGAAVSLHRAHESAMIAVSGAASRFIEVFSREALDLLEQVGAGCGAEGGGAGAGRCGVGGWAGEVCGYVGG